MSRLPSCHAMLDRKMRVLADKYSIFGFIGVVIRELLAYIALLEEELARREAKGE